MKPSKFTVAPFASILQKSEAEKVARNIMVILARTGDNFREISWKEYKDERLKDGAFSDIEKNFFDKVLPYCTSVSNAALFSPVWAEIAATDPASPEPAKREFNSGNKHQWQDDWDKEEQGELNEEKVEPAHPEMTVEQLPDKINVHSTELLEHKAELHPINDPDGEEILADVNTLQFAEELAKRYNNYPSMYAALKIMCDKIHNGWEWTAADISNWEKNTVSILSSIENK